MKIQELTNELLKDAVEKHTSDIFLFPKNENYHLAFRFNNSVHRQKTLSKEIANKIINYFKYQAQMDISEHRRPQVGSLKYYLNNQEFYLRLSSLGSFDDSESLVIRIIYPLKISNYFFREQLENLLKLSNKRGLIITSGPTGSGKTTTMYEIAKSLSKQKVVMTIEDPVEIYEERFFQTQVNNEAEIDYVSLLKAALRHRPDILIIGEIRDYGTARLAVDAALSGHLVLATLHAKSTLQTITRLEGLGIKKTELTNCLTAVSYQRLIPTQNGLTCLLDVAAGSLLKSNLSKIEADFVDWKQNLNQLKTKGKISEQNWLEFQEG